MSIKIGIYVLLGIIITIMYLVTSILNNTTAETTAMNATSHPVIEPNTTAETTAMNATSPPVIEPDKPSFLITITPSSNPIIAGEKQTLTIKVKDFLSNDDLPEVLIW